MLEFLIKFKLVDGKRELKVIAPDSESALAHMLDMYPDAKFAQVFKHTTVIHVDFKTKKRLAA